MKESDGIRTIKPSKVFREELFKLRRLRRLSQLDMATELGISPQYYHDLENGRRLPSVRIIYAITSHLQLGHRKAAARAWHIMAARSHGWDV